MFERRKLRILAGNVWQSVWWRGGRPCCVVGNASLRESVARWSQRQQDKSAEVFMLSAGYSPRDRIHFGYRQRKESAELFRRGHNIPEATQRSDVKSPLEEHATGTRRPVARSSNGVQISPAQKGHTRNAGSGLPVSKKGDLCSWLFLACASLQKRRIAVDQCCILAGEDRPQSSKRPSGEKGAQADRMEISCRVGVRVTR